MEKSSGSKETIMSLVQLPEDVLAEILSYLDTKTVHDLYQSCDYFKNAAVLHKVRECKFSLNNLATAKSLNSDFFMDISRNVRVLNLSGVHDLTKFSLIPALENMNKLEALDVSYTNITMPDYLEIAKVRPTLKKLSINFVFPVYNHTFPNHMLPKYEQAFKTIENVHFVGNYESLLYSNLVTCILDKANVHSLKLTVVRHFNRNNILYLEDGDYFQNTVMARLSKISIKFADINYVHEGYIDLQKLPIFASIDLNNYEVLTFDIYQCKATPLLKDICANLGFHVDNSSYHNLGVSTMLWSKEKTRFDAKFKSKLLGILEEATKFKVKYLNLKQVPGQYKWCDIDICTAGLFPDDYDRINHIVRNVKDLGKPTYKQTILYLNIDDAIKDKETVKLKLSFWESTTVGQLMFKNSGALKNITHLFLFGNAIYCSDFFYNLFAWCDSLVTLEIIQSEGTFSSSYLEFIPKHKVFKNILINVREIDFFALFTNLSKCRTLENIHLVSTCTPVHTLPSPKDLFINCNNLYNLHVQAVMNDEIRESMLESYINVRSKLKKYAVNIDVLSHSGSRKGRDPYDLGKDDLNTEIHYCIHYPKIYSPHVNAFSAITMNLLHIG